VSLILVFALLAINGSELFHHHSDTGTIADSQCSVCVLVKSVQNLLNEKSFTGIPVPSVYNPFTELITRQYSFPPEEHNNGRAPPPVSHI